MSDSVQPHRRQPTRLCRPWGSPGKNTGVGCHFLLQCMKVKSESGVAQSCLTLSDPMDCSLPGSSIHGIFQARVLEWVAIGGLKPKIIGLICWVGFNKWKVFDVKPILILLLALVNCILPILFITTTFVTLSHFWPDVSRNYFNCCWHFDN